MLPQLGGTGNAGKRGSFALRQHVLPPPRGHFAMPKAPVRGSRGWPAAVPSYSAITIRDNWKPLRDTLVNNSRITTGALHQFNTKRAQG
jgi:hypothetical protein